MRWNAMTGTWAGGRMDIWVCTSAFQHWQDGNSLNPKFVGITFEGKEVRTVHLYLWQQIDMLSYDYVLGNIALFYIPKHVII